MVQDIAISSLGAYNLAKFNFSSETGTNLLLSSAAKDAEFQAVNQGARWPGESSRPIHI